MKVSENALWNSVYAFIPSFEKARERGVKINLVSALRDAAVEAFVQGPLYMAAWHHCASIMLREALKELDDTGILTFGEQTSVEYAHHKLGSLQYSF